jgi:hypothetical protein
MQPNLPWILLSAILVLAALGSLWWFQRPRRREPPPLPTDWALSPRPVFSTDERRVYRQLREALPHYIVLSKLPLVRFCQPIDPQEVRYWYELLGTIHVTFAICSANGRVLAAIDLDTDRHSSRRTIQIKQSVLGACRVRYLRCSPDELPSVHELQLLVPQTAAASRGPQAPPSGRAPRDVAASTAAARRRERSALWQDSGFFQDSFFGIDSLRDAGPASGFGTLGGTLTGDSPQSRRGPPAEPPEDVGGIVVESTRAQPPMRH